MIYPTGLQVLKKCRVSGRRHFCHPHLFREGDARMDARPKTRQVDRERLPPTQVPGPNRLSFPCCQQYDSYPAGCRCLRAFVDEWAQLAPELFPEDFDQGDRLDGFGRASSGFGSRPAEDRVGQRRRWPSFIFSDMTGTVDQLAYPLRLGGEVGVSRWLLTIGFGHSDVGIRVIERLGETVWWEPPSLTRHSCPSIWWSISITPMGRPEGLHPDNRWRRLHFGHRADRPRR